MSDDGDHSCHCAHVVVIQTKVATVQWLMGICIVAVVGALVATLGSFIARRVTWDAPPSSSSERLFLDRVSKPDPPSQSDDR